MSLLEIPASSRLTPDAHRTYNANLFGDTLRIQSDALFENRFGDRLVRNLDIPFMGNRPGVRTKGVPGFTMELVTLALEKVDTGGYQVIVVREGADIGAPLFKRTFDEDLLHNQADSYAALKLSYGGSDEAAARLFGLTEAGWQQLSGLNDRMGPTLAIKPQEAMFGDVAMRALNDPSTRAV